MTQPVSNIPLTAELFDAMFDNDHFRARLKARYEKMRAETIAAEAESNAASLRLHGTESILREEFSGLPEVSEEIIDARRQELYAEYDKRIEL